MSNSLALIEVERVREACGVVIADDPQFRSELEKKLVSTWDGGSAWELGRCKVCGEPFTDEPREWNGLSLSATVCERCGPMVSAHYSQDKDDSTVTLSPWWDEHCPIAYRDIINGGTLPPNVDSAAFKRVQAWGPSEQRGLVLIGSSGAGKTLSLWQKARDLERGGLKPTMLSAVDFARRLSHAARDLEKAEWLMRVRVLIIDDLGKEKLSGAISALLWEVLDARNNARLPTLISTRFKTSAFVARFTDPILGEDIRGRIADSAQAIVFGG